MNRNILVAGSLMLLASVSSCTDETNLHTEVTTLEVEEVALTFEEQKLVLC